VVGTVARAMSRFWRVDKALEDSEGLRRIEFHCNPSFMCSRRSVLLPGSSAPTNDVIFKTFSSGRTEVPLPTSRIYLRSRESLTREQAGVSYPGSIGGQNLLRGDHLRPAPRVHERGAEVAPFLGLLAAGSAVA
jgi:hypothetical protein